MIKMSKLLPYATAAALVLAGAAHAGCYNSIPDRDKWLASWIDRVPERGAKVEWKGETYTRKQAIKVAKKDIAQSYAKRGADASESPAALAAFAVMDAGGVTTKAERAYNKRGRDVSFQDAVSCFYGYLK